MRALACLLCLSTPAVASSEDAWAAFREKVHAACLSLVQDEGTVSIEVNPFGTESYGIALITVASASGEDRMACVFDKTAERAELSAPFDAKAAP